MADKRPALHPEVAARVKVLDGKQDLLERLLKHQFPNGVEETTVRDWWQMTDNLGKQLLFLGLKQLTSDIVNNTIELGHHAYEHMTGLTHQSAFASLERAVREGIVPASLQMPLERFFTLRNDLTHDIENEKQVLRFAKKLEELVQISAQVAVAYGDWVRLEQKPEIAPLEKPAQQTQQRRPALSQERAPAPGQAGRALPAHRVRAASPAL